MYELPLELVDFAEFLADEARKITRMHYRGHYSTETKADKTPVTEIDKKIEENIRKLVEINFPSHAVFGEEFGRSEKAAEYTWVIDPIDGTKSFISGRPLFGTLIALTREAEVLVGIIDQPITNERWLGANGVTKFNNNIIQTKAVRIDEAIFATTSPFAFGSSGQGIISRISDATKFTLYGGDCYSYGQLALGLVDIVVESGLKPYDFCALIPIIENAGGKITDWQGRKLNINSTSDIFACGDELLHRQMLQKYF